MKRKRSKRGRCRKVGYATMAEANTALKQFGRARGAKKVYRCKQCTSKPFHLTSRTDWQPRRRRGSGAARRDS